MGRFVVFGGAGFIGEHVVECLRKSGEVIIPEYSDAGDPERVADLIKGATCVLWLIPPSEELKKVVHRLSGTRVVYASTSLLYSSDRNVSSESSPLDPQSAYELGKYEEERLLHRAFRGKEARLVIARFGNVYGDRKNTGVIGKIFESLAKKAPVTINDPSVVRDFVHVSDVSRLLVKLALSGASGIYNISTGVPHSLGEILEIVERVSGEKVIRRKGEQVREKKSIIADNTKVLGLLNEKIEYDLESGLRATYSKYRN